MRTQEEIIAEFNAHLSSVRHTLNRARAINRSAVDILDLMDLIKLDASFSSLVKKIESHARENKPQNP